MKKGGERVEINVLHLIEGAKAARGLAVVIDVFRAFSLEAYCFARGASAVYPVADADVAFQMKREHPDALLLGERHGAIIPGCDSGNSPSELMQFDLSGRVVIHTTSAGTQGIENAGDADEILGGSLVTARATAEYIRRRDPGTVSLVCMGWEGVRRTDEDILCAEYLRALILGQPYDLAAGITRLRKTEGAKFFDPAQSDRFPTEDFYLCTKPDLFPFVLRYDKNAKRMERID